MVRAMHLSVTIHTGITRSEGIGLIAKIGITAMAIRSVTLLTQLWRFADQHGFVHAAMGIVAISAVVGDGGMFPQFRAAFFGMTAIAIFINTHLLQA